ncbi:MAG: peptidylprolyl isomerase [Flavobacteriales bacterium]|jgi:peptidyl-prolyl cis-trans isomerase SurA|nr:peptidylprolyl isomerase [Flavobacteriales bacterium]
MKHFIHSIIALLFSSAIYSQGATDPVLLTIDGKAVTKSEFEQIFWKNKKETVTNKKELDDYMVLFKKFKLKVAAAEDIGLDTTKKFKSELAGYRAQLERPYLVDTTLNEALLKEAYHRIENEVRASHILIEVKKGASPKDTLAAYNRILNVRSQILDKKISFDDAALKFSTDPSAKHNKGDLGFFSAFRMVYPFENAAFNTSLGTVSMPFRTQFGYHIVQPTEERKGRGKIKVAHIMLRIKEDASNSERENLKKKAEEIYQKINAGGDYAKLAQEFSEDRNSARKGGEIGWINTGETFAEFDNAAFELKTNNAISKPVKSPVGWHIIKRLDYKPVGSYEEMRSELKHKIQRDVRSQKTREQFIANLKKEYGFIENKLVLESFYKTSKSELNNKTNVLFSFAKQAYTREDFNAYLTQNKRNNKDLNNEEILDIYNKFVANKIVEYEKTQLERKHPEFRALLKEYRDGILLFDITDQMVWSKAVKDTTGLKAFYETTQNNYMWPDRLQGDLFSSNNKKTIKKAYKLVKKGKLKSDSIVNFLNQDSQLNIQLESGIFEQAQHQYLKNQSWKKGLNKVQMINGKYVFCNVKNSLPSQPKKLDEAKGLITAAYQEHLEKEWLKTLEAKHKIIVDEAVLYAITKK